MLTSTRTQHILKLTPFSYHRASDLADAQKTVQQDPRGAHLMLPAPRIEAPFPLAHGLQLDLRNLDLDYIRNKSGSIEIGALTTLQSLADSPLLKQTNGGIVAGAALHCTHYGMRNLACAGGAALAAGGPPDLQLALLVLDAQVHWDNGTLSPIGAHHPSGANFPIQISFTDIPASAALHAVRRTPRDEAIVAVAVALRLQNQNITHARVAIGGLGSTPARCLDAEQALTGNPHNAANTARAAAAAAAAAGSHSDYRGSSEYRHAMACVLTQRALSTLAPGTTS